MRNIHDFFNQPVRLWHLLAGVLYLTFLFGRGGETLVIALIAAAVYVLYHIGSSHNPFGETAEKQQQEPEADK